MIGRELTPCLNQLNGLNRLNNSSPLMILTFLALFIPLLSALSALGLAVFVLTRNWRAWANRWLALGLLVIGVYQALLHASSFAALGAWRPVLFRLALATAAIIPPSWLAFSLMVGENNNGGLRLIRWRPALYSLTAAVPLVWIALAMGHVIQPVQLAPKGSVLIALDIWGKVYFSFYLVALALVLLQLENLYHHTDRLTRHKIRFLIVGIFLAFGFQIVAASYVLVNKIVHPLHSFLGSLAFLMGEGMMAFSVVRHRLLDVDIFVSRYLVFRSLTLVIVGVYLVSLGVAAEIFQMLNFKLDLLSGTILAILVGMALCLILLSKDVHRRTKNFIHTHFYRHKYDYQVEWMELTRRVISATTVSGIAVQTVSRILEVMWIRRAAMYVAGDSPRQMVLTHQVQYAALPPALELPQTAVQALQEEAKLIPSIAGQDESSRVQFELARQFFGDVPVGCLVPVAASDTLVGLLIVGPEVSGKPFGVDDRDLLLAVAAQAGALVLNARLSQEASEGRELQVLARLSAFVAHDLKNMVSSLSMLTENAKVHLAKPEFQADAIRTLGDVTARMQKLLAALRSPGAQQDGKLGPTPLATTVEAWLKELAVQIPPRIRLETRLGQTPDVSIDPEQFRSVLQNLIINGIEAIPDQGNILVETLTENGSALLSVSDTGRGMTSEFIRQCLFHPFQTTKKRGLGIGLYQCRQIVEAHGGTLSAESQEGKGTRMTVKLPGLVGSGQQAGEQVH